MGMSMIEIGGVKISYSSLQGLGEQKAKSAQAIAGAGCGREAAGVLH
jgi:hypothetical protein